MTIEERLENMERELGRVKRRNRWLLGAILVLVGGLVAAGVFKTMVTTAHAQGAGTDKQIRANSFVLDDENGKPRAILGLNKNNLLLGLQDENGKPCASLGVDEHGPALKLFGSDGKVIWSAIK
jgi:hypothetical protein